MPPLDTTSRTSHIASLDWRWAIRRMSQPDDWVGVADPATEDCDSIERHRLSRQRPDGLLLNLRRRRVYVCEFTHAHDSHPDYEVRADQYKFQKYHALLTRLRASLPSRWKVEFISFTAGVNGSIPQAVWLTHFNKLCIRLKHQCDSIFQKVSATLSEVTPSW